MPARTPSTAAHPARGPDPRCAPPRRRAASDRGQSTVLVAAVVAVALVLLVGVGQLGAVVVERARARTAADAAALAGAVDQADGDEAGRRGAVDVATRNGATLTGYRAEGTAVEVTVRVGQAHATARAERVLAPDG